MKSPLIIFFLLFNLLAVNLAPADNIHKEELSRAYHAAIHHTGASAYQAHSSTTTYKQHSVKHANGAPVNTDSSSLGDTDDTDCNHFCHFSAHMAGFLSHISAPLALHSSTPFSLTSDTFYSLSLAPPSQPPRV